MIKALYIFLIVSSTISSSLAQNPNTSAADLSGAKKILINKPYTFQESPKGYGEIQEFPQNSKRSDYYFIEERNTMWLLIDIPFNGILEFEIEPHSNKDDYDWMLFNNTPGLSEHIQKGDAKLLRSNNSRNDIALKGKTGLLDGYLNFYESPGKGKSYSKPLAVKKGQKLALVIDNIYEKGAGFNFLSILKPKALSQRTLQGIVTDKNTQLPLPAKIICEDDSTGVKMGESIAGRNGIYSMQIPADRPVNITAVYPEYSFETVDLKMELNDLEQNFHLEKAAKVEKLLLFNIHFTPDRDLIKQNSEPELDRLIAFLKTQKDFDIRIIGHTNNNPFADVRYLQKLSFNRAIAVKKYLIENGISDNRISCAGMGGKSPLVITKNTEEGLRNLRVEVVLNRK